MQKPLSSDNDFYRTLSKEIRRMKFAWNVGRLREHLWRSNLINYLSDIYASFTITIFMFMYQRTFLLISSLEFFSNDVALLEKKWGETILPRDCYNLFYRAKLVCYCFLPQPMCNMMMQAYRRFSCLHPDRLRLGRYCSSFHQWNERAYR